MLTLRRARLAFKIAAAFARAVPFWSLAEAAVCFLTTGFFAGAFWTGFLAGAFFPSLAPLAAGFLSAVFLATGFLASTFFAGAFLSAGFLAAAAAGFFSAGLATGFFSAGLAAGFEAAAGFFAAPDDDAAGFFSVGFAAGFLSLSDSPAKKFKKWEKLIWG